MALTHSDREGEINTSREVARQREGMGEGKMEREFGEKEDMEREVGWKDGEKGEMEREVVWKDGERKGRWRERLYGKMEREREDMEREVG